MRDTGAAVGLVAGGDQRPCHYALHASTKRDFGSDRRNILRPASFAASEAALCPGSQMIRRLLAITGAVLVIWTAGSGTTAEGAQFSCWERVLTDYGRALEKMPGDRLPQGELPFAPGGVELRPGRSVVVNGEPITYTLGLDRPISEDGSVVQPANLGWMITLRLDSVDHFGRLKGTFGQRRWRVERLRLPERQFDIRADPGTYRVSVTIGKFGGPSLASFRQFVRVVPLREKLSIGIRGDRNFQRGETVVARIENAGTREALLPTGSGLTVERLEGGLWARVEPNEPPSAMFEDPEFLSGGRASRCSFFMIPVDFTPGAFRFSAVVERGFGRSQKVVSQFAVS